MINEYLYKDLLEIINILYNHLDTSASTASSQHSCRKGAARTQLRRTGTAVGRFPQGKPAAQR